MQCPKCHFQNRDGVRFCNECDFQFTISCPKSNRTNPSGSKFCNECGYDFTKTSAIHPQSVETPSKPTITDQERKHSDKLKGGDCYVYKATR